MLTEYDGHVKITDKVHVGIDFSLHSWGLGIATDFSEPVGNGWRFFMGIHILCFAFWVGVDY